MNDSDDVRLAPNRRPTLGRRRTAAGWLVASAGPPLLTLGAANVRPGLTLSSTLLGLLLLTVSVAVVGGTWPGIVAAVSSSLLANWFFTEPYYTFTIHSLEEVIAIVVFVLVAILVSGFVSLAARRAQEATRARTEAEVLAGIAGTLAGHPDPVPEIVARLRAVFGLRSVAVLARAGASWAVEASAGAPVPRRPHDGDVALELVDGSSLVLTGGPLGAEDRRVASAFAAELAVAIRSRRLAAEAAEAQKLAAVDELRTALLAAVSHDLRTPLASIKASVTSLLQPDVEWKEDERVDFLRAVDADVDHLNTIVGNLLDMSRLQTGTLEAALRPVALEEVIPAALGGLRDGSRHVQLDLPESLPLVRADPALLERAVANLVENAFMHAQAEGVSVMGAVVDGCVEVRVADRGPGIAAAQRALAFRPFQRLGDRQNDGRGVGLGLAVAKGFVEAMSGRLEISDTAGGGLTMVLTLQTVDA